MSALETWVGGLRDAGLAEDEIAQRRAVLEEFCAFAHATPDELVERCVNREKGRIKVGARRETEAAIEEFGKAVDESDPRGGVVRANVVRSFLIHNGVRVLAPRASWL